MWGEAGKDRYCRRSDDWDPGGNDCNEGECHDDRAERDGRPAVDLSGTSFACPTAVAVLACALAEDDDYKGLPRDGDRARWVVDDVLPCYACNAGLGQARQGLGVPAL